MPNKQTLLVAMLLSTALTRPAVAETTLNALFMAQAAYSEADVRAMTDAFTAANPEVKVNLEFVPYEGLHDKTLLALGSGSGYDVVLFDVIWPADVRAGATGLLRMTLRHGRDESLDVDVRAPLPPGVTLAAKTAGVTQLQGALLVRRTVGNTGAVVEIPVRFALAGRTTAPEAMARLTRAPAAPAFAPARSLVVRPR